MALTKVTNSMISGSVVNVFDYMTDAEIADVQARTEALDVTTSVQAAIDSLSGTKGGIIFFPKGTYKITDQLIVPESDALYMVPIGFEGETSDLSSYSATTIRYTKTSGVLFQCRGVSGILTKRFTGSFKNLDLQGPGSGTTADGINPYSATGMLLDRINIKSFRYGFNPESFFYYSQINDCNFSACVYGIYTAVGAWNGATISRTRLTSCTNLIYLQYCGTNVNFIGCTFESATSYMVNINYGLQASFIQCYFEGDYSAIQFNPDTTTAGNNCTLSIIDSYFEINAPSATRVVNVFTATSTVQLNVFLVGVSCAIPTASTITSFLRSSNSSTRVSAPNGITTRTSTGWKDIPVVENALLFGSYAPILFTATVSLQSGTGSPEGVVSGGIGSLFTRTDGGAGTTLYVKESGTGNTGWVAK